MRDLSCRTDRGVLFLQKSAKRRRLLAKTRIGLCYKLEEVVKKTKSGIKVRI